MYACINSSTTVNLVDDFCIDTTMKLNAFCWLSLVSRSHLHCYCYLELVEWRHLISLKEYDTFAFFCTDNLLLTNSIEQKQI